MIKQVARQSQSTNFHLYVAVLQVLLFRLLPDMNQTMIGIADANRASQQTMETLGFFLNVLPIRLDRPASDSTFRSMIKMVRNSVYGVLEHSALPFDVLLNELKIDRTGNAPPLFQVFVDYRIGTQERTKFANCKAQGEKWYNARTGYDVSLDILENSDGDTLLSLDLQQSLYTKEHAELLLRAYVNLLKAFTATPDVDLAVEIPGIWAVEDISKALRVGTGEYFRPLILLAVHTRLGLTDIYLAGPATSLEWPPTVAHRIDQMIYLHGPKSALKDDRGNNLTYNEMGSRVDAITRNLVKNGVCKGMTVGVMQEPSAYWVCSMLAIFRVGAIYLPLDLRNSIHRIRSTIRIAHPNILLTDQTMVETAEIVKTAGMAVIDVSQVAANPAAEPTENLASSDSPAVVLFTSGSTSEPKGILIKHSNLIAQIESNSQQYNLADGGASMVLQQAAFSFDMSLDQIFNALTNGGCLFVVPAEKRGDPSEIAKLMVAEQMTYTLATPSEYQMWFHFAGEHLQKCSRWQYAFMGGEHIPRSLLQEIRVMNSPSLRFVNIYGPTETTITCTSKGYIPYQITDQQYPLPAGFPAPNYAIYIVDDQLKPLPIGVPGEIVVGGAGVSAGYLGMDASTQEKFLPSPFAHLESNFMENKWLSIYRTGDCGFLQDNGALYVTGRIKGDTQVKLHGFRIELGEIESTLIKTAGGVLVHAFVIVKEQKATKFLVAHAVFSSQQTDMDRQEFLDNLRTTLPVPDYMRPAIIVPLENIPLNAHSKTDRAAIRNIPLPMPDGGIHKSSIDRETTSMEASLEELWRRVLPKSYWHSITPDTNFFHVGGSSLLIVRLQRLIKDEFQAAPMVNELMNAGRLIDMASLIEKTLSLRIDWHAETTIPDSWANEFGASTEPAPRSVDNGLRILLTGATGYVGWNLLPLLIRSSNISEIFCLVRFGTDTDSLAKSSDKISIFTGDLGMAGLGLSNARFDHLATETDVILHCGANRSFWDDYEPLRSVNVSSVKELARLALHRRIPLHFLTSGAARIYEDNLAVRLYEERKDSVHVSGTPPDDGSDGYVASKWAAEHFLTNVSETFALPVVLHRFEPVPGLLCDPQLAEPETDDTLKQLIEITKGLGVRPAMNELNGWVDIVPSHTVVENICAIVLGEREDRSNSPGLVVRSHAAERRVNWSRFIQELKGNDELAELPSMPTLQWIGQAKRAGFGYFMSSHRLAVVGEAADDMVSRR